MAKAYDPKTFQLDHNVGYLMKRLLAEMFAAADREMAPLGLTSAQFTVLAALASKRADSPATLCAAMADYDRGAMTRMIDRLQAKGLVRRVRDAKGDRRAVRVELTPGGKALYPRLVAGAAGVLNRFLTGFSEKEHAQLAAYLQRMLANA